MDQPPFQGTSEEQEALCQFLRETSTDGVFVVELSSGTVLSCNRHFLEILGCENTNARPSNFWDIFPEDILPRLRERITEVTGRRYSVSPPDVFTVLPVNAFPFEAEVQIAETTYRGRPAIQGILRKMTEPMRLRQRYRQAQKMEAVGTLSGGIAHEFNNLMHAISGYAELLMYNAGLAEPVRKKLESIQETTRRAADLTREFMLFNRPVENRFRNLNLNLEVVLVQKLLSKTFPPTIRLRVDLDPALSEIHGDSAYMGQLLLNLNINAMEAMPEGGELRIETRNVTIGRNTISDCPGMRPGEYVALIHSDTGHGMEPDILGRIFEPAFTTRQDAGHRGLGLSMVKDIVRDHRGYITCQSGSSGTVFTVYFPVMLHSATRDHAASEDPPTGRGKETILFADDEEMIRNAGREFLSGKGYTVLTAENGKSALATFRQRKSEIDLVLLNLIMQGGGEECLDALHEIDPSVKVIVTSGYSPDSRARKRIDSVARAFLAKPYDLNQLLNRVRSVLDPDVP